MTAFFAGINVLFLDPHLSRAALWRASGTGAGVPVRIIKSAPDDEITWRDVRSRVPTVFIDVRVSEVAALSKGDTFEIAGDGTYEVVGAPSRDIERLVWKAEARVQ